MLPQLPPPRKHTGAAGPKGSRVSYFRPILTRRTAPDDPADKGTSQHDHGRPPVCQGADRTPRATTKRSAPQTAARHTPSTAAPSGGTGQWPGRGPLPLPPQKLDGHLTPAAGLAAEENVHHVERRHLVVECKLTATPVEAAATGLDMPVPVGVPQKDISAGRVGEPTVPPVFPSLH